MAITDNALSACCVVHCCVYELTAFMPVGTHACMRKAALCRPSQNPAIGKCSCVVKQYDSKGGKNTGCCTHSHDKHASQICELRCRTFSTGLRKKEEASGTRISQLGKRTENARTSQLGKRTQKRILTGTQVTRCFSAASVRLYVYTSVYLYEHISYISGPYVAGSLCSAAENVCNSERTSSLCINTELTSCHKLVHAGSCA